MEAGLKALPRTTHVWGGLVLALMLFLVYDQHAYWERSEEYYFGFLVPLFVAFLLYDRWPRFQALLGLRAETQAPGAPDQVSPGAADAAPLPADPVEPQSAQASPSRLLRLVSIVAGLAFVCGWLLFALGALYRAMEGRNLISSNLFAYAFPALLLGGAWLFAERAGRGRPLSARERLTLIVLLLFPAFIWILSVPMMNAIDLKIRIFLQQQVAQVVFFVFNTLGFSIIQSGTVLQLPSGTVGVEDACSGIRSLMACLFAGSFLGAVFLDSLWKKVTLLVLACGFAFFFNLVRSLFLTGWVYGEGSLDEHLVLLGLDLGTVHDATGWMILMVTVGALLLLVHLMNLKIEWETPATPQGGGAAGPAGQASAA